ncbi:MAG TPA: DNA-binding protein WhiA, partial [Ruminococcaceae bacterium]|nr:DNA-binding protein WhiA [Oscillospiraceae bacterium]
MSFSFDTKTELCRIEPERDCCVKAECYGMLLFARSFSRSGIALVTENRAVARRAAELTVRACGVIADVSAALTRRRNSSYTLGVQTEHQRDEILRRFGYTGREISLRINRSNLENECCHAAFVRGAFLSCGTVTDPHKDYHLEFNVPFMNLAKDLMALLSEDETLNLQPALINRKGAFVVYVKGSEHIADLLAYLGAG